MKKTEVEKNMDEITHNKYRKEDWIEFIRTELLRGKTRYEIYVGMSDGRFPQLEGAEKLSRQTKYTIIDDAYKTCAIEYEEDRKKQREIAYERFLDMYREARQKGDTQTARQIMDSIVKLTGLNEPQKIELGDTVFQINLV